MSAKVIASVNPKVLSWARTESGYDIDSAAGKLRMKPERLIEWEKGDERPSLRQAERLAALYHRPLPVLFLAKPPPVVLLAAEFRHLPGVRPGEESPELRLALRTLRRRREIALELMEENEEQPPGFKLSARLREEPEIVGKRLRESMGITIEDQRGWADEYEAWRTWRDRAEALGMLVFQIPFVALRQMRGVSLFREPLPVVGINSKDHPLARIFTLIHEITHLMLLVGGDEKAASEEKRKIAEWNELERFTDSVAAATLMPLDMILTDQDVVGHNGHDSWSTEEVSRLARRYRVSPVAFMTRLATLNRVSWAFYGEWRLEWEKKWENRPKSKQTGGPSRTDTILSRVGPTYASLIMDSLARDLITPLAASDALDLKVHHFDSLKSALMFGTEPPPVAEVSEG